MFKRKTVFILGAGASWHYGYPTGETIVRSAIQRANLVEGILRNGQFSQIPQFVRYIHEKWRGTQHSQIVAAKQCRELADKLSQINPIVIDFFLSHNPDLADVGKFIVAWVLLECEAEYKKAGHNVNRTRKDIEEDNLHSDDWYRFLLHRMTFDMTKSRDLVENNHVHFVTFNYDRSLDKRLEKSLRSIQTLDGTDVTEFLEGRVLHVYGSLESKLIPYGGVVDFSKEIALDQIFDASQNIRVMNDDKGLDEETIAAAQKLIRDAEVVYILGFGFDRLNCERLELQRSLLTHGRPADAMKTLCWTNMNDSNRVNKEMGRLVTAESRAFLAGKDPIQWFPSPHGKPVEKSIRDVYGAFAYDFDAPEQL